MSALERVATGQSQQSHSSATSTPKLNRTQTFDALAGVLNHLTEPQEQKLVQFKERLQKDGWWTPNGVNGKPSHDDGTLLRYLRARKFDVNGAYGQFTDTEKWMKKERVEELYENFDVETYDTATKMYPQWTGHRDKRGIPIYVFQIKGLDSKAVHSYQKMSDKYKKSLPSHSKSETPSKLLPLFALYHNLLNFVLPLVSSLERPNPEVPVTNSTNIVDITGVGLTQFWNLKAHMQDASVLATAHYPETLDRIFIIGAPSFFPTVWGWIKRWFDPVTVSKIFILGKNEVKPTLSKYMEQKDIPRKYGGELNWDWGDSPHLDDMTREAVERDGNKGWVKGPTLWLDHHRVAVGTVGGKPRAPQRVIAENKPVLFAADYTDVPVHENKRASVLGTSNSNDKAAQPNGVAQAPAAPAATAAAIHKTTSADVQETVTQSTSHEQAPAPATATARPFASEATRTEAPAPVAGPASAEARPTEAAPIQSRQAAPANIPSQTPATTQASYQTGPITSPPSAPFSHATSTSTAVASGPTQAPQTAAPTSNTPFSFYSSATYAASQPQPTTTQTAAPSGPAPTATASFGPTSTSTGPQRPTQSTESTPNTGIATQTITNPSTDHSLGTELPIIPRDLASHLREQQGGTSNTQAKEFGTAVKNVTPNNHGLANGSADRMANDEAADSVGQMGKENGAPSTARPGIERFITAAEF